MKRQLSFALLRTIVLSGLLWLLCANVLAIDKTISVYVDDSFTISPWSDVISSYNGYACEKTWYSIEGTSTPFLIEEILRTKTAYEINNNMYNGFYCSYNVKALTVGDYIIYGYSTCHKRNFPGGQYITANPTVTYRVSVKAKPKVISITMLNELTLQIGNSYTFSPIIAETGASTTLKWTSSNTSVVTISGQTIKAIAPGLSIITCTADNGVSARCVVTVPTIDVTKITLSKTSASIAIGGQTTITATVSPSNASNKKVEWSSTDPSIAIVSSSGTVTGISEGYCNVNAMAMDGSGIKVSCLIQVRKRSILANSISIDKETINLKEGQTEQLTALITPSDVSNPNVLWSSSNPECVSVNDNGIIKGVAQGTATITVTTKDGTELTATCDVKVSGMDIDDYDNTIYTNNAFGCVGGTVTIPIKMKNKDDVTGFQFNLFLPDGFSITKVARGERIKTKLNDEYVYSFDSALQVDGSTFVLCYSSQNVDINGNDGDVVLATVKIPEDIDEGEYTITLKAIELSKAGSSIVTEQMTSILSIANYTPGDANNDGRISVADLTSIASHMMGNTPVGFNYTAADANSDGRISVADLTTLANKLMNAQ